MSTGPRPLPTVLGLDIHTDQPNNTAHTATSFSLSSNSQSTVLQDLSVGDIQNNAKLPIESLVDDLENFHINSPARQNTHEQTVKFRGSISSPDSERNISQAPSAVRDSEHSQPDEVAVSTSESGANKLEDKQHPLVIAGRNLLSNHGQLSKQQAGQFEWVLAIPSDDSAIERKTCDGDIPVARKLFFGCNLVHRQAHKGAGSDQDGKPADIYTLLATPIKGDEASSIVEGPTTEEAENMSMITQGTGDDTIIARMSEIHIEETDVRRTSEVTLSGKNDDIPEQIIALPSAQPTSRIEDSVEALDKLEEQLEALSEVTQVDRVLSPEERENLHARTQSLGDVVSGNAVAKQTDVSTKKPASSTVRVKKTERASFARRSTLTKEEEKPAAKPPAPRKLTVTRPASLLPPKAPAKSSKPPTVPTFELPGDAVARKLKEKREARLSQMNGSEHSSGPVARSSSPSKPLVKKTTKPPTLPKFELPGDAISRRKREEREAKLKAQEEEERKRREFKARPIRASIAPGTLPRQTAASIARQVKATQAEKTTASAAPTVKKRHSIAVTTSASHARLSTTAPTRGRGTVVDSSANAHVSRATSTSTGSIHGGGSVGKRSAVSAEEVQQQKQRAKEIFARDNSFTTERERERREREAAAKQARQEAAERSREWAKRRSMKVAATTA
ncbi:hypothetical protein QBC46DRAFT_34136 [Diplogelasinospora grovesii]|uniref:Carboxylesterase family protein n=1 Tax=Diplogelasinospora grovesii TaxID=303347 RepID=A0AAN6NCZ4_9PEZI|nr:hypothetical protein QBC46DRAFT_34136 [Diplogelasinospora grovesii]